MKTIVAASLIAFGLFLSSPSFADDDCRNKIEVRGCKLDPKYKELWCTYTDDTGPNACGISTKETWDQLPDRTKQEVIREYGMSPFDRTDRLDKVEESSTAPPR